MEAQGSTRQHRNTRKHKEAQKYKEAQGNTRQTQKIQGSTSKHGATHRETPETQKYKAAQGNTGGYTAKSRHKRNEAQRSKHKVTQGNIVIRNTRSR
jgi:hypothetical protein